MMYLATTIQSATSPSRPAAEEGEDSAIDHLLQPAGLSRTGRIDAARVLMRDLIVKEPRLLLRSKVKSGSAA